MKYEIEPSTMANGAPCFIVFMLEGARRKPLISTRGHRRQFKTRERADYHAMVELGLAPPGR